MSNKFTKNIHWSAEDECFVVTFPEFPLLSAFGETEQVALKDAKIVLKMAIASLKKDAIPLPTIKTPQHNKSYSGQVRLRMGQELHQELTERAERSGISLNSYIISSVGPGRDTTELSHKLDMLLANQDKMMNDHKILTSRQEETLQMVSLRGEISSTKKKSAQAPGGAWHTETPSSHNFA